MSDEVFIILLVATAPLAALIPAVIALNKGRSFLGFYIYGLFFWLIALIHSLVMEPAKTRRPYFEHTTSLSNNASAGDMPKTRDLSSDAYKLYLAKKYSIERNDVFEKFVCDEKLFSTLDEALIHADSLEANKESAGDSNSSDVEMARRFLYGEGYKLETSAGRFRVKDPAGGWADWKTEEELIEYAKERGCRL